MGSNNYKVRTRFETFYKDTSPDNRSFFTLKSIIPFHDSIIRVLKIDRTILISKIRLQELLTPTINNRYISNNAFEMERNI